MNETMQETGRHLVESPKAVTSVGSATAALGGATIFDYLPDAVEVLGAVGVLIGICVSIVGIRVQFQLFKNRKIDAVNGALRTEKLELEIQALRDEKAERVARAADSPRRRYDDGG